jgi:hypothetical protein
VLQASIEDHLRICPECLAAVAELRSLLRAGPVPVPAGVVEAAKGLFAETPAGEPVLPQRHACRGGRVGPFASFGRVFALLRTSAAWAGAAALVIAACAAGFIMGQEAFPPPGEPESPSLRAANGAENPVIAEFDRLERRYLKGDPS